MDAVETLLCPACQARRKRYLDAAASLGASRIPGGRAGNGLRARRIPSKKCAPAIMTVSRTNGISASKNAACCIAYVCCACVDIPQGIYHPPPALSTCFSFTHAFHIESLRYAAPAAFQRTHRWEPFKRMEG
jgi:hypothetical protein